MKKVRKFKVGKFLLFLLLLIIIIVLIAIGIYKYEIGAVSSNTDSKIITIDEGDNYISIASKLKEQNLIRSETFYRLYLRFANPSTLMSGDYELNEAMSVPEIIKVLSDENSRDSTIKITFREGLNITQIAKIVEEKTDITAEEFINKLADTSYLQSLKQDYWFITDEIYNKEIYYPLEGYLYPDTYHFEKSELNIDDIVRKILDNTETKLAPYKDKLQNGTYTTHQILTLASIVELEAVSDSDRALVAGVLYNRLNDNWSLGCDATTYYAAKKSMTERLTQSDLTACNGYNTRCTSMTGLPVGPIDNPSISSIKAALNPTENDYYYFVADTDKKVYFTKNATEHDRIISKLRDEGKWAA